MSFVETSNLLVPTFRYNDVMKEVPCDLNTYDLISFDGVSTSVNYLKERTKHRPKISIICGSGLGIFVLN